MRRKLRRFNPCAKLWYYSTIAHRRGWGQVALALKLANYALFHNILCFEAEVQDDLDLVHFSHGTVVHPNVTLGRRVKMFHNVTLAAESLPGVPSEPRIVVEDDVTIGAYAMIIGRGLRIGRGATIGACAMITCDVEPGVVAKGVYKPARADATP